MKQNRLPELKPTLSTAQRNVLTLRRSAERLDDIEQDLIRKLTESHPIDRRTNKLIAEMRICTNRLRSQLADMSVKD